MHFIALNGAIKISPKNGKQFSHEKTNKADGEEQTDPPHFVCKHINEIFCPRGFCDEPYWKSIMSLRKLGQYPSPKIPHKMAPNTTLTHKNNAKMSFIFEG